MSINMKTLWILLSVLLMITRCSRDRFEADAYGNFEAVETLISAENTGKVLKFAVQKGQNVSKGDIAAIIDTTILVLQKDELLAKKSSVESQLESANAQIAVVNQQLANLRIDLERVQKMVKDQAATQKQLDDLLGQEKILKNQLTAAHAQKQAVVAELQAVEAKQSQLNEQLRRCSVVNPVDGTILNTYVNKNELTAAGKPLYKIASLDTLELVTYVSGGDLHVIRIGQDCTVRIDDNDEYIEYNGTVIWISDQAEFTPKMIQTKEERVNLVYAVKILVPNDGRIKVGMPGEVIFE